MLADKAGWMSAENNRTTNVMGGDVQLRYTWAVIVLENDFISHFKPFKYVVFGVISLSERRSLIVE